MKVEMLQSQLATLEEPEPGEALVIDCTNLVPTQIVDEIRSILGYLG
jgi:gluconate kinase